MKRKNRKTVMIVFIIGSIFLSACGENRESGTKTEQEPEGPKAADLAVVQEDAGQEPEETERGPETESGVEDYTFYSTYEGFLIQDEEALEKCMDDLQNHYQSGKVTLRIASEMADLDTSALAEMIWERDLETEWKTLPEAAIWEGRENRVVPTGDTEYAACVYFENSYYQDHVGNPLLYRPEESGIVPNCMQPFLSEEVRSAISEADIEEDEYLGLFMKQDVGAFHYFTYGFSSGDENNVGSCSHVLLWILGERADGTHVSQVLEVPLGARNAFFVSWDCVVLCPQEKDLNRDGENDLLIEAAPAYCGFLWNEKSGQYELFESLPGDIMFWMKDGAVYTKSGGDGFAEYCTKYELIDGVYQETQRVECEFVRLGETECVFEIREYRNGELVFSREVYGWLAKNDLYSEMPW